MRMQSVTPISASHAMMSTIYGNTQKNIWTRETTGARHTNAKAADTASIHEQKPNSTCIRETTGGRTGVRHVTKALKARATCVRYANVLARTKAIVPNMYST